MKHDIKPLNVQLINQIAAGEVIEGPFSAVKELVENAIDARATEIRVEIVNGGKSLIAVTDNGIGIPGDQIKTAFLPHTTSKLRTIDDLQHINTLGFRGEALASIAAVSRVEVQTRAEDSLVGYKAIFENGSMQVLEEAGCPAGTRITVRDLFYQTPARLKFMKSDGAETSHITEMLTRLALSRTDISFQYVNNNKIMLTTRKNTDPNQTVLSLFPSELAHGLTVVEEKTYQKGDYFITISGLIGQPHSSRGNRNYQVFFVNGRSVRNDVLTHAFERAYEGAVMVKKFPVGILYVSISPELLDVNVHPSKTSIKFQEPHWMEEVLLDYVQQGLQKNTEIVSAGGLGIGPTATELKMGEERRRVERLKQEENDRISHNEDKISNVYEDKHEDKTIDLLIDDQMNIEENIKQRNANQRSWEHNNETSTNEGRNNEMKHDRMQRESSTDAASYKRLATEDISFGFVSEEDRNPSYKPEPTYITVDSTDNSLNDDTTAMPSNNGDKVKQQQQPISAEHISQQAFLNNVLKQRNYKIVGQAFKTYIILESGLALYLVDQHAAHERVVYDQLLADAQNGAVEIQEIMDGQIVELTLAEMEWFRLHEDTFSQMGFIIEPYGHQAIRLTGVPYHLGMPAHHEFLQQLIDELIEQEWSGAALPMEKLIRKACRYAIKAHDSLMATEINALLDQMTQIQVPLTCPHGRPIVLQIRDYDLEKLFKRV